MMLECKLYKMASRIAVTKLHGKIASNKVEAPVITDISTNVSVIMANNTTPNDLGRSVSMRGLSVGEIGAQILKDHYVSLIEKKRNEEVSFKVNKSDKLDSKLITTLSNITKRRNTSK